MTTDAVRMHLMGGVIFLDSGEGFGVWGTIPDPTERDRLARAVAELLTETKRMLDRPELIPTVSDEVLLGYAP